MRIGEIPLYAYFFLIFSHEFFHLSLYNIQNDWSEEKALLRDIQCKQFFS